MSQIKFLFLPFLLFVLFFNPTPCFDADKQKHLNLNITNGANDNIFLEIRREKTCGDGQGRLLICYPSKMLNFNGNAKASRRFQLIDQGNENFAECRKMTGHNGLLVNFQGDQLNIKTSFDKESFSCPMESKDRFGIHLRGGASLLSSLLGCADKAPCDAVYKIGDFFNRTMWEAHQVPYVDDFGPLWYLGLDMVASNATKNGQITYLWQCPWTVEFSNVSKSLICGEKVPTTRASSHSTRRSTPTTKSTIVTTKVPTTRASSHSTRRSTLTMKSTTVIKKGEADLKKDEVVEIYPTFWFIADAGFLARNKTGDCADWNSVMITICYDGLLDPTRNWQDDLELPNAENNTVAEFCKQKQPNGSRAIRHGFAVGACAERLNFTVINNGAEYELGYRVSFNITLSYSNESYEFAKEILVPGKRKEDGTWKLGEPSKYQSFFSIQMGTKSTTYATLIDSHQGEHDFASQIEKNRASANPSEFREIAKGNLALGLLGRDLIPRLKDDEIADWKQSMQPFIAPKGRCTSSLDVRIYDKSLKSLMKKLKCLTGRVPNYCDILGWELFKKMADGKRELEHMDKKCAQCNGDDDSLPTNIPPYRLKPRVPGTPYTGPPFIFERKKRSSDQFNGYKLVQECEDVEENDVVYHGRQVLRSEEMLEQLKAERKNCCNGLANVSDESKVPKVTTKSIEAHRRRKRQLYIDESWRWNTTILYRFKWNQEPYPEKQADWEEEIRKGLDHISNLTCLQFIPDDSAEGPHLIFTRDDRCSASNIFGHHNIRISIGTLCEDAQPALKMEMWAIVAHEVCHGLGFTHEQQRSDRNRYIWVNPNVVSLHNSQYEKEKTNQTGLSYDFSSLMHYEAFKPIADDNGVVKLKKDQYAMISLEEPFQQSMVRTNLQFKDAKMLNQYYCTKDHPFPATDSCDWNTTLAKSCQNGGYLDPKQGCKKCRCPPGLTGDQCIELETSDPGCGPTELVATPKSQILIYNSTADPSAHKCIWRIKKNPSNANQLKTRISIEFIENGFKCEEPCEEWLEIKYKSDKTSNGAHVCCNFTTELGSDKMPLITAEQYETEVLLILYDPLKRANFKISYKAGHPSLKPGTNCSNVRTLIGNDRRNPDTNYVCRDLEGVVIPCEDAPTENEDLGCFHYLKMEVNGMEVSRDGTTCTELSEKDLRLMSLEEYHDCQRCIPEVIERNPHCKEITRIWCLKSDDVESDQWYWKNAVGDLIRISNSECRVRNDNN